MEAEEEHEDFRETHTYFHSAHQTIFILLKKEFYVTFSEAEKSSRSVKPW